MASRLADDPRIDPRIKAVFGSFSLPVLPSVASREELLAQENSESALAEAAGFDTAGDIANLAMTSQGGSPTLLPV